MVMSPAGADPPFSLFFKLLHLKSMAMTFEMQLLKKRGESKDRLWGSFIVLLM